MSIKITEEQYAAAIPSFCGMGTTLDQHMKAMLCWGLVNALEEGRVMDCSGCIENMSLSEEERNALWDTCRVLTK